MDFDQKKFFFFEIPRENGDSMIPFIKEGDLCLCHETDLIKDFDIVAALWEQNKFAVKIFFQTGNTVTLFSTNPNVKSISLPRSEVKLYKVVLIKKKF